MQDIFDFQRRCLRLLGNVVAITQQKQRPTNHTEQMFYCLGVLFIAVAIIFEIKYCVFYLNDLSLLTSALSIILTSIVSVVKMSTFFLYKNKFLNTMQKFSEMFDQMRDPEASHILKTENALAKRLAKAYFYCTLFTGFYFMLTPWVKLFWMKVVKHEEMELELPFPMRFPFGFQSAPVYLVLYIYSAILVFTVVMYSTAVDSVFFIFAFNLRAHFKSLQTFIERPTFLEDDDNDDGVRGGYGGKKLQKDIRNLMRYHKLLLQQSEEVCEIYKPVICGQLLITSLDVCVIVYRLVSLEHSDIMNLLIYATFLCAILLQLFIYCYGGEIVSNESLQVGIAIQLSNWYNLSPSHRRMLLLMLLRSQRAVSMRAYIYDASLVNFMMILKAAMSYITLIQSIE